MKKSEQNPNNEMSKETKKELKKFRNMLVKDLTKWCKKADNDYKHIQPAHILGLMSEILVYSYADEFELGDIIEATADAMALGYIERTQIIEEERPMSEVGIKQVENIKQGIHIAMLGKIDMDLEKIREQLSNSVNKVIESNKE